MIDPVAIQLGSISIRWYAIFIVSGLLLAVYLAMKEAPRRKIIPDDILDFILIAFPLAIIGARVYYVIFDWSYYANQPLSEIVAILERWPCYLRWLDYRSNRIICFFLLPSNQSTRFFGHCSTWCHDCASYWTMGKFHKSRSLW